MMMMYKAMCFLAYHAHAVLHWAAFQLLPYAGAWEHRHYWDDRKKANDEWLASLSPEERGFWEGEK